MHTSGWLQDQSLTPLKFSLNKNSGATSAPKLALASQLWILEGKDRSPSPGSWKECALGFWPRLCPQLAGGLGRVTPPF